MKNRKLHRMLAVLLAGSLALSVVGCSQSSSTGNGSDSDEGGNVAGEVSEGTVADDEEETQLSPEVQEKIDAAQACVGKSVDELKAAIGEPNSSGYEESTSPDGGQIGFYYYDNFTVSTSVADDGSETVDGVW